MPSSRGSGTATPSACSLGATAAAAPSTDLRVPLRSNSSMA
jgi:hypothetical protein